MTEQQEEYLMSVFDNLMENSEKTLLNTLYEIICKEIDGKLVDD